MAGAFPGALPATILLLLAAACGARYELGEVLQPLDDVGSAPGSELTSILIGDGPEDMDVAVGYDASIYSFLGDERIGDVDGDGHDDWITNSLRLVYGGPRVTSGTFPAQDTVLTTFSDARDVVPLGSDIYTTSLDPNPAGDVNGDGYADILFMSQIGSGVAGGDPTGEMVKYWPAQRAYLWYGRAERTPGEVRLGDAAVAFEPLHELRSDFDPSRSTASHRLRLQGLGDIDGDGFDDVAYSYTFSVVDSPDAHTKAVTLFYYGGSERLPAVGAERLPVPQLTDTRLSHPIGDIDGDGDAEFFAGQSDETAFVVPGGATRLTGQASAATLGRAVTLSAVDIVRGAGDLDHDGAEDFIISEYQAEYSNAHLFYGGAGWASTPIDRADADASFHFPSGRTDVTPVGDWNGDGFADLVLAQQLRGSQDSALAGTAPAEAQWAGEARIITGSARRYAGAYETPLVREGLEPRQEFGGPVDAISVGDIDGDGFADAQITLRQYVDSAAFVTRSYIKYGGPLGATIR